MRIIDSIMPLNFILDCVFIVLIIRLSFFFICSESYGEQIQGVKLQLREDVEAMTKAKVLILSVIAFIELFHLFFSIIHVHNCIFCLINELIPFMKIE